MLFFVSHSESSVEARDDFPHIVFYMAFIFPLEVFMGLAKLLFPDKGRYFVKVCVCVCDKTYIKLIILTIF